MKFEVHRTGQLKKEDITYIPVQEAIIYGRKAIYFIGP